MADEGASDASSDSSNTFWDLATCAAAVAAYAAENPNATAIAKCKRHLWPSKCTRLLGENGWKLV